MTFKNILVPYDGSECSLSAFKIAVEIAKKSNDFRLGYVFGKMEHKFVSWFYSEYGRSQTDQEYEEFSNIVLDRV